MNENNVETGGCLCGKIKYEFNRKDVVSLVTVIARIVKK